MTSNNPPPEPSASPADDAVTQAAERKYDRTGFYPSEGKQFRIWALVGWNTAVVVILGLLAAVLNHFASG